MFAGYRRERALRRDGFPDEWRAIVESNVVHWRVLDAADRGLLEDYVVRLVTEKRWEAARGFALTDEIQVTIAAQAACSCSVSAYEAYRGVGTIIVHPTTMQLTRRAERADCGHPGPTHRSPCSASRTTTAR